MSEQLLHPITVSVYVKTYIWQGIPNTFRTRAKRLENCWLWAVWHTCFISCDSVDGVNPDLQLDPVLMFFICIFDFYKLVIQVRGEEGKILSLIGTFEWDCPFAGRFSRHEDIFQLCHLQYSSPQDFVGSQASQMNEFLKLACRQLCMTILARKTWFKLICS